MLLETYGVDLIYIALGGNKELRYLDISVLTGEFEHGSPSLQYCDGQRV